MAGRPPPQEGGRRRGEVPLASLGLQGDAKARKLLRRAFRASLPARQRFGWQVGGVRELPPEDPEVGHCGEDGTLCVKVRQPGGQGFYSYAFVLATLLHELTHLSHEGHGEDFYCCLQEAVASCDGGAPEHRLVEAFVCDELFSALRDNDARRARAMLAVIPGLATRPRLGAGGQMPLEYAAYHGRVALTRSLLAAKADAAAPCHGACSVPAVARAAAMGNTRTLKALLLARADAGATDLRGLTALDHASAAPGPRAARIFELLASAAADGGEPQRLLAGSGGDAAEPAKGFGRRVVSRAASLPALRPPRNADSAAEAVVPPRCRAA